MDFDGAHDYSEFLGGMHVKSVFAVAAGGAIGSALRYLVTIALLRPSVNALPWGTFTVNVTGALMLGFLARYFAPPYASSPLVLALTLGLCGGYTTFSTFTLEMFTLIERGTVGRGILYAVGSVVMSYGAFAIGHLAARILRPLT